MAVRGGGGGMLLGQQALPRMVPDGKGGFVNGAEAGAGNANAPNLQATPEQHASYTGPEFSKATPNGSGVDYFSPGAPSSGGVGATAPGTAVPGGGGEALPGANASGDPQSVASLMNITGMQGADSFHFLGNNQGTLRPLGQRLGVQDSAALAGLQRRIY